MIKLPKNKLPLLASVIIVFNLFQIIFYLASTKPSINALSDLIQNLSIYFVYILLGIALLIIYFKERKATNFVMGLKFFQNHLDTLGFPITTTNLYEIGNLLTQQFDRVSGWVLIAKIPSLIIRGSRANTKYIELNSSPFEPENIGYLQNKLRDRLDIGNPEQDIIEIPNYRGKLHYCVTKDITGEVALVYGVVISSTEYTPHNLLPSIFELAMYMFVNKLGSINKEMIEGRKNKSKDDVFLGLRILVHELASELQILLNEANVADSKKNPLEKKFLVSKIIRLGFIVDQLREMPNLSDKWFPVNPYPMKTEELALILEDVKIEAERMWPDFDFLISKKNKKEALIFADHNLRLIIRNLVYNAAHFSPDNGQISINVVDGDKDPYIHITVEDEGPGIKKDDLENLFVPGKTCRKGGTGLGLYIAREISHSFNGEVRYVDSEDPGGRFLVLIPYAN